MKRARNHATRFAPLLLSLVTTLLCCAKPVALKHDWMVKQVSERYHTFYSTRGDPDWSNDAGLLRPRFGLPAIVQSGGAFDIEVLERGPAQELRGALLRPDLSDAQARDCLAGQPTAGCFPLWLGEAVEQTINQKMTGAGPRAGAGATSPAGAGATSSPAGAGATPSPAGAGATSPAGPSAAVANPAARTATVLLQARPIALPPAAGYDLYLTSRADAPTRVPRAVWLRDDDPEEISQVKVAHLSDLHIGKGRQDVLIGRLVEVIADVNRLHPDLVVITGDLVNQGQDPNLPPRAQALLLGLNAPLLVIMGNHDIGFKRMGFGPVGYGGSGWSNFARSFHSYLHYSLNVGGYDFVGFDSGPSLMSPRVLTRGVSPGTLDDLRDELLRSRQSGHRGVVLFSHAPSRATLFGRVRPEAAGSFGRMYAGSHDFEQMMLDAAAQGQRVLHLAGHTHWSDVFEAQPHWQRHRHRPPTEDLRFSRWPMAAHSPCLRPIAGKAALITTQAASHAGLFFKDNAKGYGFSFLLLGDGDPEIAFHRYGIRHEERCPDEADSAVPKD